MSTASRIPISIDLETFSFLNLKQVGVAAYAAHDSTRILTMSYRVGDSPVCRTDYRHTDAAEILGCPFPIGEGYTYHAHNAAFERALWFWVFVKRYGWENIPLEYWRCTAARVAQLGLPRSLKEASTALRCAERKDDEGHKVMMKLCKPRKPTKNDPRVIWDEPELYERQGLYCDQDVRTETNIHAATPDPQKYEAAVWQLDQRINDRGIPVDVELCRAAITVREANNETLNARLNDITAGMVDRATKDAMLQTWLNLQGVNIGNTQADTIRKETKKDHPEHVLEAMEIRLAVKLASLKKYDAMLNRSVNGRVYGAHLYYGSHTGRFSGKGVQFQNVKRGEWKEEKTAEAIALLKAGDINALVEMADGDLGKALQNILRSAVCASEGHRLLVADFSQIEARVLAWLADQMDALDLFRTERDPYLDFASKLYPETYDELYTLYEADDTETDRKRFLCKTAVLGLGFQMGAKAFRAACKKKGVDVSLDEAQTIVTTYRDSHSRVRDFWYAAEDAAITATKAKGKHYVGRISFERSGQYLFATLPSKRRIVYPFPEVRKAETPWGKRDKLSYMGTDQYHPKFSRIDTYGGKLVENLVQGTARDFLIEAMFRCERKGYPIVMHVHDEAVAEVPESIGTLEEFTTVMKQSPNWGADCPVEVSGFEAKRYRK